MKAPIPAPTASGAVEGPTADQLAMIPLPVWNRERKEWVLPALTLDDIPPTPVTGTRDLVQQIREGWQVVMSQALPERPQNGTREASAA